MGSLSKGPTSSRNILDPGVKGIGFREDIGHYTLTTGFASVILGIPS